MESDKILNIEIQYIMNDIFLNEDEMKFILEFSLNDSCRKRTLTTDEERILFLRYNYVKYRAKLVQENVKKSLDIERNEKEFSFWYKLVQELEERLIKANLALAISAVSSFSYNDKDELLSECNASLLKAIRTFNVERGKFSTWGMANINFAIKEFLAAKKKKQKEFSCDDHYFESVETSSNDLSGIETIRSIIDNNEAHLTDVEMKIIKKRFFEETRVTHTIIGTELGISREWSRKHEKSGLNKLRDVLNKINR